MRWAALGMVLAGCLHPQSRACEGGGETWVCPEDLACAAAPTYCGTAAEVGACEGKADGAPCATDLVPDGHCTAGVCEACSNDLAGCRYVGWNPMTSPVTEVLSSIAFAETGGEAYAGGDNGTVLRYQGTGWARDSRFPSADLAGQSVTGLVATGTRVYAFTNSSKVYLLDGGTWSALPNPAATYKAMWATGSDVFLAGPAGRVAHFDGATWTETTEAAASGASLAAIWGTRTDNIYAVGSGATILHYDGAAWTAVANPGTGTYGAVWLGAGGNVFVAGTSIVRFDGSAWAVTPTPIAVTPRALWGAGDGDVFAVGDTGTVLHWDGVSWTQMQTSLASTLRAISGSGPSEVFAVGDAGTISRYTGAAWAVLGAPGATSLRDVWAAAPNEAIAVGTEGIFHLRDQTWTHETATPAIPSGVAAVCGRGPGDALVAGNNISAHWDGAAWTSTTAPIGAVADAWATPGGYYAVADQVSTYDGSSWTLGTTAVPSMRSVWVAPSGRVWVAGDAGIAHLDGAVLTSDVTGTAFAAVWGAAENDLFAAGTGAVQHFDGATWTAMPVPTTNALMGVWGRASDDVFAVGRSSTVLHYHGGLWQQFTTPFIGDLTSVSGAGSSNLHELGRRQGLPPDRHGPVAARLGRARSGLGQARPVTGRCR